MVPPATMDYREIDRRKLLERVSTVQTSVQTSKALAPAFAGTL
jgi:hypothetical protein